MKQLNKLIQMGILKENSLNIMTDLDDTDYETTQLDAKDINSKYDMSATGKRARMTAALSKLITEDQPFPAILSKELNNPKNFELYKGLIIVDDKYHLLELIEDAMYEFGDDCNLNWIDTSNIEDMSYLFDNSNFNGHIELWNTSNVTTFRQTFYFAERFNGDISEWDVSNAVDMGFMFSGAKQFNQPLDKWDVGGVENMQAMFANTNNFNQNINSWDVSLVTNMTEMFAHAIAFNQNLYNWDTSSVNSMAGMFQGAKKFNRDISEWDVSNVEFNSLMFLECNINSNFMPQFKSNMVRI